MARNRVVSYKVVPNSDLNSRLNIHLFIIGNAVIVLERVTCQVLPYSAIYYIVVYCLVLFLTVSYY